MGSSPTEVSNECDGHCCRSYLQTLAQEAKQEVPDDFHAVAEAFV